MPRKLAVHTTIFTVNLLLLYTQNQSAFIASLHAGMHGNSRFEALAAVLLKVQFLWDVTVWGGGEGGGWLSML